MYDSASDDRLQPQWYVVRSKPRAEHLAAAALQSRGLAAYLPLWRRRRRGRPDYHEPLFPGYLFVQSDGVVDWVLRARSAPNVARLLGSDRGPEPVPEELVAELRERCDAQVQEPFVPGQHVRIARGPFRDLDAVFDAELSAGQRARVFVQTLYRLVPVIVEADMLRRTG
jgi:transcriptional antiterminator RfaH